MCLGYETFAQARHRCCDAGNTKRRHHGQATQLPHLCFVCGIDNAIGLHLRFYTDEEGRCVARFRPKPEHQGHPGQLHGGLVSTLLDTVMVR